MKPIRIAVHLIRLDGPAAAAREAARTLLRELLAARLGCPATAVEIVRGSHGKPRLASGNFEFSLSHCDGWCAVALSPDAPVGIDVEPIHPLPDMARVAADFFPLVARTAFDMAAPGQQEHEFFQWWTRIEAAVKASGEGLDTARSCFDGVVYESYDAVPGLAAAVAAKGEGPMILDWRVSASAAASGNAGLLA